MMSLGAETVQQALTLSMVGLAIVFAVLAIIALSIVLMRKADDRFKKPEGDEQAVHEPTIDTTTLVVISAAVAACISGRYHIRSVRRVVPRGRAGSWTQQGRTVLQGSHVIVKKR